MGNAALALLISIGIVANLWNILRCISRIFEMMSMTYWDETDWLFFVAFCSLLLVSSALLTMGVLGAMKEMSS